MLPLFVSGKSWAHDPIFSPGPHVLYKGGVETALHIERSEQVGDRESHTAAELTYGVTGDWAIGLELPYVARSDGADGIGNPSIFTKYRFWRDDQFRAQESAAILARLISDLSGSSVGPDATDALIGLTYGYEGLTWYRWASARYRYNGKTDAGLDRGDKGFADLAIGYRPTPPSYYRPDTVFLLELNGEWTDQSTQSGVSLANSGGRELFLSPGIFWTLRNFAVKSGVQVPVWSNLNGMQAKSDYRGSLTLEFHW